MYDIDRAVAKYKKGEISLFEAADLLDLHPKEFLDILMQKNRSKGLACKAA